MGKQTGARRFVTRLVDRRPILALVLLVGLLGLWVPALDRQAWVAIDRSRARVRRRQPRNLQGAHSLAGHRCPRMKADIRRPEGQAWSCGQAAARGLQSGPRQSGTDVRTPWRGQVRPRPRGLSAPNGSGVNASIVRQGWALASGDAEVARSEQGTPRGPSAASGPEPLCRLVNGDDDTRTNARGEGSFCGAGITAAAGMPRASYRLHSAAELSWLAVPTIDPVCFADHRRRPEIGACDASSPQHCL